jgi:hypothetical protein
MTFIVVDNNDARVKQTVVVQKTFEEMNLMDVKASY